MTPEDMFFTQTIVGQPFSVPLGTVSENLSAARLAQDPKDRTAEFSVHLATGQISLSDSWQQWCLLQGAYPYLGRPRQRPGSTRRWLERHALLIAAAGLSMLLVAGISAAWLALRF